MTKGILFGGVFLMLYPQSSPRSNPNSIITVASHIAVEIMRDDVTTTPECQKCNKVKKPSRHSLSHSLCCQYSDNAIVRRSACVCARHFAARQMSRFCVSPVDGPTTRASVLCAGRSVTSVCPVLSCHQRPSSGGSKRKITENKQTGRIEAVD